MDKEKAKLALKHLINKYNSNKNYPTRQTTTFHQSSRQNALFKQTASGRKIISI